MIKVVEISHNGRTLSLSLELEVDGFIRIVEGYDEKGDEVEQLDSNIIEENCQYLLKKLFLRKRG